MWPPVMAQVVEWEHGTPVRSQDVDLEFRVQL